MVRFPDGILKIDSVYVQMRLLDILEGLAETGGYGDIIRCVEKKALDFQIASDFAEDLKTSRLLKSLPAMPSKTEFLQPSRADGKSKKYRPVSRLN